MNIFYAPPEQILENRLALSGQEARHAAKTLRYGRGDEITAVDGAGGWYEGKVSQITDQKVWVHITSRKQRAPRSPRVTAAIGIIKKRDRLEFAVEKAVELGAAEIAVFQGDHSIKQNVRADRLETLAVSAMKQSLQSRLPQIHVFNSLHTLLKSCSPDEILAAHKSGERLEKFENHSRKNDYLLITGPEGDFSNEELQFLQDKKATFISLGENRLRTETAVITFLNSFLLLNS